MKRHWPLLAILSGFLIAWGVVFAQGIVKSKELRIFEATEGSLCLDTVDESGICDVELRLKNGNEFEFYASPSVTNTLEFFVAGLSGTSDETGDVWLQVQTPVSSPVVNFPLGIETPSIGGLDRWTTSNTTLYNNMIGTTSIDPLHYEPSGSNLRWELNGDTSMCWGDGACDTNLYRSAANVLKTDDAFEVNGCQHSTGTATPGTCTPCDTFGDTDGDGSVNCAGGECYFAVCGASNTWYYPVP